MEPRNWFQLIDSDILCSLAGRYVNYGLQIRAQRPSTILYMKNKAVSCEYQHILLKLYYCILDFRSYLQGWFSEQVHNTVSYSPRLELTSLSTLCIKRFTIDNYKVNLWSVKLGAPWIVQELHSYILSLWNRFYCSFMTDIFSKVMLTFSLRIL